VQLTSSEVDASDRGRIGIPLFALTSTRDDGAPVWLKRQRQAFEALGQPDQGRKCPVCKISELSPKCREQGFSPTRGLPSGPAGRLSISPTGRPASYERGAGAAAPTVHARARLARNQSRPPVADSTQVTGEQWPVEQLWLGYAGHARPVAFPDRADRHGPEHVVAEQLFPSKPLTARGSCTPVPRDARSRGACAYSLLQLFVCSKPRCPNRRSSATASKRSNGSPLSARRLSAQTRHKRCGTRLRRHAVRRARSMRERRGLQGLHSSRRRAS
jgi:hypothetical protein